MPLHLRGVASDGRPQPATGTFEKYVQVCPGEGVIQAERYSGKEGPWLGGMNMSHGKGASMAV